MTDQQAFIAAIKANPSDDLPRLAYADWLEDNYRGPQHCPQCTGRGRIVVEHLPPISTRLFTRPTDDLVLAAKRPIRSEQVCYLCQGHCINFDGHRKAELIRIQCELTKTQREKYPLCHERCICKFGMLDHKIVRAVKPSMYDYMCAPCEHRFLYAEYSKPLLERVQKLIPSKTLFFTHRNGVMIDGWESLNVEYDRGFISRIIGSLRLILDFGDLIARDNPVEGVQLSPPAGFETRRGLFGNGPYGNSTYVIENRLVVTEVEYLNCHSQETFQIMIQQKALRYINADERERKASSEFLY